MVQTSAVMRSGQPLKDRHFYCPEQFIWNNPYRSSSRLYKYYHAANAHYQETEAPRVQQLEREDKENSEKQRIFKVIENRNKTRDLLK
jgi:hypothetical protein